MGDPINENPPINLSPPCKGYVGKGTSDEWNKTIAKVKPAVVVIRRTTPRSFDTIPGSIYSDTGFVVDKRLGIILTNRQAVNHRLVVAEAVFANRQVVPIQAIYRDPIHDFGFFSYDPSAIEFLGYEEIPLAPDMACVGLDIRVVGYTRSEKVSILAGSISDLTSNAPHNEDEGAVSKDFNTFYIKASFGTNKGPGGSPVIDLLGRAVGLNSGFLAKSKTAKSKTAYFLPLGQVVRAVNCLKTGSETYVGRWMPVSIPHRGTLQVTFLHKGFDEACHLGLKTETKQEVRETSSNSETGMLVVDSLVPSGPGDTHLQPGDVLVRVNDKIIAQFMELEDILDANVNKYIMLEIKRGGSPMSLNLLVQDLQTVTPNHFLEISGGVIHPLSYQQARKFHLPCGLAFVAYPGFMLMKAGVPLHAIITKLDGTTICDLKDFISVLSKLSKGTQVPLEYKTRSEEKLVLMTVDRHEWYAPPKIYTEDADTGLWMPKPAFQQDSAFLSSVDKDVESETKQRKLVATKNAPVTGQEGIKEALVQFKVHTPLSSWVDGTIGYHRSGTGVIIYHNEELGLVAVDKHTVPVPSSDVVLRFYDHNEIPGEVVFLHPVHNYALVSYDPSALKPEVASKIHAAELDHCPLHEKETVHLMGYDSELQIVNMESTVTNSRAPLNIPSLGFPCYRATNMEVIVIDSVEPKCSGVLVDTSGKVRALWGTFSTQSERGKAPEPLSRGIPISYIKLVLDKIVEGANGPQRLVNHLMLSLPSMRVLEFEVLPRYIGDALAYGLSEDWVKKLQNNDPSKAQLLYVKGCVAGSKVANHLQKGDMILTINKKLVTCFLDIENACNAIDKSSVNGGMLEMTIFRKGKEVELSVETNVANGSGTTHAVDWCGCLVHDPHFAARALGFLPEKGHCIYVTWRMSGSPAQRYGLDIENWIVEINGTSISNLNSFVNVTKNLQHGEFVRVKTFNLHGKPKVLSLKQDLHYWPTWELKFNPEDSKWHRNKGLRGYLYDVRDIGVVDRYPGGPIDTSILKTYRDHVAGQLWNGVDRGELRIFNNGKKIKEANIDHDEVRRLIEGSGLLPLWQCSYEMIDKGLISAFVERWHQDTNSFHLPVGEMTITLDDVWSLLHLPITGAFFNVTVFDRDQAATLLSDLLGVSISFAHAEFGVTHASQVRYKWLLELYNQRCSQQRWVEAARAFLLYLVGCTLFTDKSSFAVDVSYLECFRDLDSCGGYAWGAAALAHLYDSLRDASFHYIKTVSGYLTLIQAWVYEHFPNLCTDCCRLQPNYNEQLPRSEKWKPKRDKGLVLPFRKALDNLTVDQVCWNPYVAHRNFRPFQEASFYRGWIRWGSKMYAHLPDRVLRQYGRVQSIPSSPCDVVGNSTTIEDMDVMFTQYAIHLVDPGPLVNDPSDCVDMEWFSVISHPYIIPQGHDPNVAGSSRDTSLPRAITIVNTLLKNHYIAPDGIPLANELMNLLVKESHVKSRDWSNVETYKRKKRGVRQTQ